MSSKIKNIVLPALLAGALCLPSSGADWPQYRGPNHDGVSPEKIPTNWPASGLRQIWKTPLNNGFSSFTLGDGKVFTLVTRAFDGGNQETCLALDAATGKELWAAPMGAGSSTYDGGGESGAPGNNGGDGARSTPTCDGGKVYAFSSRLMLKCLNASDGKPIWSCDLMKSTRDETSIGRARLRLCLTAIWCSWRAAARDKLFWPLTRTTATSSGKARMTR